MNGLCVSKDVNTLTKNKQKLSGLINTTCLDPLLSLPDIKAMTKKFNVTINDAVMCALSNALRKHFRDEGDDSKQVRLVIPCNIRFKLYETRDDIKLENKFAALPLVLPLTDSMEQGYDQVKKVSKQIKNSFAIVYASYAVGFYSSLLLPRALNLFGMDQASAKLTIGFSNTPGIVK